VLAQKPDSLNLINTEFITDQIENIASATDLSLDYSDLIDDYLFYAKNPIAINSKDRYKLLELRLINESQLSEMESYINDFGNIQSKYEMASVSGFNRESVERILPFISFTEHKSDVGKVRFKDIIKYNRHKVIFRFSQIAEKSLAYSVPLDSAMYYPGSVYLGSPQKYYLRYSADFSSKIKFGFTLEKDAGELISKKGINDSVLIYVGDKIGILNDFASFHLMVSDMGIVKNAVVGDYHLEFGQGLTLWSGLSFGKSSETTQIKKFGRGIRANTSVNENRFLRGGAITCGFGGFEISGFYSKNSIDGNLIITDSLENEGLTGIIETGNHRTVNELLDKDALSIESFGAIVNYRHKQFSLGLIVLQTNLDMAFVKANELYKKYYFTGNSLINYGLDFTFNFKKVKFFGEISSSNNTALAGLFGTNIFLGDRFIMTIMYRNFSKKYFNFYNNPFREGGVGRNEQGYYFGIKVLVASNVSLNAYADYYRFPWIRYGISSPSLGSEYLLQLNYAPYQNMNMYFRIKFDNKQENYRGDYDFISQTVYMQKKSFRFNISYSVFDFLLLKNRVEMLLYQKTDDTEYGFLIYQDVLYRPDNFPLSLSFRYAIFSTDGWDSRIYAYENDVLYAFSVPAYYDRGQRIYLMLKLDAFKNLDLWLRVGRTIFRDKTTIGSGADEINSNHKTEIKIQAKIRL